MLHSACVCVCLRATEGSSGSLRDDERLAEGKPERLKERSERASQTGHQSSIQSVSGLKKEEEEMMMKRSLYPHCSKQELANY